MEREIKEKMKAGGRLRVREPRGGKRMEHSKPGEPPFVQSGNLRASYGYRVNVVSKDRFSLEVGAIRGGGLVKYARRLELGGSDSRGIYIAPRPVLFPTLFAHVAFWPKQLGVTIQDIKPKKVSA